MNLDPIILARFNLRWASVPMEDLAPIRGQRSTKKSFPAKSFPRKRPCGRPGTRDFFGSSRKEFLPASCSLQGRAKEYQRAVIWAGPGSRIDLKRPGSGSGFGRDAARRGHARAVVHVGIG